MELPIDHFQLLGVRPATDAQTVLHTLQQRLDRPPEQGFTAAALEARAVLLRDSADLLSDPVRRQAYEAELMALDTEGGALTPGLDVPHSREIGALLLLLEAGQAIEAFDAARRCLQPPQAPALGSHREADLTLLAGEACRLGARELQGRRLFERAAQLLQEGITLMRRTGRQPEQQRQMERDLADLLPFRVLDLLRRDLSATEERAEGLKLLEMLVERRGGLEGDGDPALPRKDFQDFFKQIRQYLTVQEQVDLFSRWASGNATTTAGSATAEFLASLALTASGFAQRKPERIAAAQLRLEASGQPGLQPFLACQHLLLGRVATAEACFIQGAEPALRAWAAEQGERAAGPALRLLLRLAAARRASRLPRHRSRPRPGGLLRRPRCAGLRGAARPAPGPRVAEPIRRRSACAAHHVSCPLHSSASQHGFCPCGSGAPTPCLRR